VTLANLNAVARLATATERCSAHHLAAAGIRRYDPRSAAVGDRRGARSPSLVTPLACNRATVPDYRSTTSCPGRTFALGSVFSEPMQRTETIQPPA